MTTFALCPQHFHMGCWPFFKASTGTLTNGSFHWLQLILSSNQTFVYHLAGDANEGTFCVYIVCTSHAVTCQCVFVSHTHTRGNLAEDRRWYANENMPKSHCRRILSLMNEQLCFFVLFCFEIHIYMWKPIQALFVCLIVSWMLTCSGYSHGDGGTRDGRQHVTQSHGPFKRGTTLNKPLQELSQTDSPLGLYF